MYVLFHSSLEEKDAQLLSLPPGLLEEHCVCLQWVLVNDETETEGRVLNRGFEIMFGLHQ